MANKYLIHGATYCGKGDGSAVATYTDEPGTAWNNIGIFEGNAPSTYGSTGVVAAGDTVYIRSKDSGGGNITVTLSANKTLGSSAATTGSWVTWIIDGGTVWSGVDGIITYTASANYYCTQRDFNYIKAEVQDAIRFINTTVSPNAWNVYSIGASILENALVDASASTYINGFKFNHSGNAVLVNLHAKIGTRYGSFFVVNNFQNNVFINPNIELLQTQTVPIFNASYSDLKVIGGSVSGSGATNNVPLTVSSSLIGSSVFNGLKFPNVMKVGDALYCSGGQKIYVSGSDSGLGAFYQENWGNADSRGYNNYPYLNATLPDSASTGWSWKLYSVASLTKQVIFPVCTKLYTADAAALDVTVEFLVADTLSLDKKKLWFEITYVDDTTGLKKTVSSYDSAAGAFATSTAGWSATTYGSITLVKRKVTLTTPTTVKKDTGVMVTAMATYAAATENDIIFICPDVTI